MKSSVPSKIDRQLAEYTGVNNDGGLGDFFESMSPLDPVDIKLEQLAAHLSALLSLSRTSRAEIAEKLGVERSQITRLLGGNANPTIATVVKFCFALGYDADVIFRQHSDQRARQPWENIELTKRGIELSDIRYSKQMLTNVKAGDFDIDLSTLSAMRKVRLDYSETEYEATDH